MSRPVAITGIGVVSALGVGVGAFWEGLRAGRTGCAPARRIAAPPGGHTAEAPAVETRTVVRTSQGRRIDRTSLMALSAARQALADAAVDAAGLVPERTGLGLASALGNLAETATFLDRVLERGTGNPLLFPNLVMNAALSYVSIELGITGPTVMLTEQEASGEAAIAWGARLVADGAVDLCVAGAADELTDDLDRIWREARLAGAGVPRPLDRDADGACPGEGAGVFVLEPLERARARGARVYACLEPHDGFGVAAPVHGWPRQTAALAAGLAPLVADADLIVAAASGDPVLDRLEAEALSSAVGGRTVPVTAPRGATGAFGGAGALAVATAALALAHGEAPPTSGCRLPARADLAVVVGAPQPGPLRVAVVDGLARGGICRPLRLERAA